MNKEFKGLLLKLASLPRSDQSWILNKLTPRQQGIFDDLQGNSLLKDARRFRKLPCPQPAPKMQINQLPAVCTELAKEAPLYIAIILAQGQFHWEQQFLQSCQQKNEIDLQCGHQLKQLKPATRLFIFQQWQSRLDFNDHLETAHG